MVETSKEVGDLTDTVILTSTEGDSSVSTKQKGTIIIRYYEGRIERTPEGVI